jgi:ribosomal protein L11 methyltransferase
VTCADDTSEGLTNFLWELGAVGVVEDDALHAYFPPPGTPADLAGAVTDYLDGLRALGHSASGLPVVTPVEDEPWADAWKAHFTPIALGRRLLIAPPWDVPESSRVRVVIEPGRAFGTGGHGSTTGSLVVMERQLEGGRDVGRALDAGTGSGILAVAATLLGVSEVIAIDEDPEAVTAARANAERNGVASRIRCVMADVATYQTAPLPLVVANILAPTHVRLAATYRRLVEPGGILIVGGSLEAEAPDVVAALERQGFALRDREVIEGWATLAFTAP